MKNVPRFKRIIVIVNVNDSEINLLSERYRDIFLINICYLTYIVNDIFK